MWTGTQCLQLVSALTKSQHFGNATFGEMSRTKWGVLPLNITIVAKTFFFGVVLVKRGVVLVKPWRKYW